MGISSNAILFCGFPLNEDEGYEFPWNAEKYDDDWELYYTEKIGIPIPTEEYSDETKKIFKQFWDKKRDAIRDSGCEIGIYCSFDYPMYYVGITQYTVAVYRGDCQEINTSRVIHPLDINPLDIKKLKEFCDTMGIEFRHPKWYMVSLCG